MTHGLGGDRRCDRSLQVFEPTIEVRIVTPVFDDSAGMGHGGAVAFEEPADLGQGNPASDMRQIHGNLTGERRLRRASL